MKTRKAILALGLALVLLLFAACGGQSSSAAGTDAADTPEATGSAPAQGSGNGTSDPEQLGGEETTDIRFLFFDLMGKGEAHGDRIVEAINALTGPQIGVHVAIQWMSMGDWNTQAQLSIASGERVDVMSLCVGANVTAMAASSQLTDLTPYLAEYAPEMLALMGDYISAYTIDGRVYGVPAYRSYCTNSYIVMRADLLDELNLTQQAKDMKTWSEFEQILDAVKNAYGGQGIYPISNGASLSIVSTTSTLRGGDSFAETEVFDYLSDTTGVVYTDAEGHIGLRQAQPGYVEELERVRSWYEQGWVYPDSSFNQEGGVSLMQQGVVFCGIYASEYGVETSYKNMTTYDCVCTQISPGMISTSTLTAWGVGVPVTAEEPEAAVKFINMLYTSKDLMNLLVRGEEGVDYEVVDGQAQQLSENVYKEYDWGLGNNLLITPMMGNGADYCERVKALNDAAPLSAYLGFTLDSSGLDLYISQITAVTDQYAGALQCGLYTEADYQEYLAKLEAADVGGYLEKIQAQLDAWPAQQ